MDPGIRPGQVPPYHQLDEYTFQDLCRDLLDAEPSVATCEVYGTRGQRQHGIDLLARRPADGGVELGQCKRYREFSDSDIREASQEFFRYYGTFWRPMNVKKFILFVSCDLSNTRLQDEITNQEERFAAFNIEYEAWSAAKITNKLRSEPGIVSNYLHPANHWQRVICGFTPETVYAAGVETEQTSALVATLLDRVQRLESGEAEQRLDQIRVAWREGRETDTLQQLEQLKGDTIRWNSISNETKAKVLRFDAGARLATTGDINQAKRLADEARTLSQSDDEARIRSLIERAESGSGAAAEMLAERRDTEGLNLRRHTC